MTHRIFAAGAFALALVSGCVTINVYFPAVAAERAADRIIDDVWGGRAPGATEQSQPADDNGPEAATWPATMALALLNFAVPPAHAAEPEIDISSPAVRGIVNSMEDRHRTLQPYYESGAIGLTREATISVRDMAAVPLAERNQVKQLVAAENEDRNALYREIAEANGQPDWESKIRATFAERWIAKARAGWYYQTEDGWMRKGG